MRVAQKNALQHMIVFACLLFYSSSTKILDPLAETAFTNTPPAAHPESGQLFALDQTLRGSLGHSQHDGSLFESQKTQPLKLTFHSWLALEQRQCHCPAARGRPFLGKGGSLP